MWILRHHRRFVSASKSTITPITYIEVMLLTWTHLLTWGEYQSKYHEATKPWRPQPWRPKTTTATNHDHDDSHSNEKWKREKLTPDIRPIQWWPQTMTATRYTMTATAMKTWKTHARYKAYTMMATNYDSHKVYHDGHSNENVKN